MTIDFVKLSQKAIEPTQGTTGVASLSLYLVEDVFSAPHSAQ